MKTPVFGKITSLCLLLAAGTMVSRADVLTWDPAANGSGSGGAGTWNLNGTANWFNGSTDVKWLDNSTSGTNTGIFGGTGGAVTLGSSLSASNLVFQAANYSLSGASTLTLGAGGIDATALTSGTTTIGTALSLPSAQQSWLAGSGSTLLISGPITRATGAAVDFSATGVKDTALVNTAGIIGAWATVGGYNSSAGDWAANDGAGNVVAYTGYTLVSSTANSSPDVTASASQNWLAGDVTGANNYITTVTNTTSLNSLAMVGDLRIANGMTLTLNSGGLIVRGPSRWLLAGTNSWLTTANPTGELFIHAPNPSSGLNWTIWPIIKDNGATPLTLVKDGVDQVKLGNMSTYTGGTIVNAGILAATCGAEFGNGFAPLGLITPFGSGPITVRNGAQLQMGANAGNAFGSYSISNALNLDNANLYVWDGSARITGNVNIGPGGATLGSTFDAPWENFAETNFPKALFIDGLLTGAGNLTIQDSGFGQTGNAWNTSCSVFTSQGSPAQNTFSGPVTVNPLTVAGSGGAYLYIVGPNVFANSTITLTGDNLLASGRMGTSTLLFGNGSIDGPGFATIGGLAGSGSVVLADTILFQGGAGYSNGAPVALSVGYNNSSTTYSGVLSGPGSLVKIGNGVLTLSGANTYTGDTLLNAGSLVLTAGWLNSSNIVLASGRTLDFSALGTVSMATGQVLWGNGTFKGSLSSASTGGISAGTDGTYGTNAITGSLSLAAGATALFDVGTSLSGPNDLVTVGGALNANNNVVHIKAPSTSANLDTTGDYLLISAPAGITGSFATTPTWDVAPLNAAHYSIQTSNKAVYLHYSAVAGPTGVGSSSPSPVLRNQTVVLTVTAANGTAGTVNSVVVDASSIGGSATLNLVNSGGNVWTNSVTIPTDLATGNRTLVATVSDTASLSASVNIPVSVAAGSDVWNGAGADNNLSTALNWTNNIAPALIGDSLQFSGATRLTPNVDNNYFVTGILFTNAGAFNIGSVSSTLTLTNGTGVINASSNIQTFSTPITLGANSTFATISNDIVVSGVVADGASPAGIIKTGNKTLTLSGADTYTGPTRISNGVVNVTGTIGTTAAGSTLFVGSAPGKSIVNVPASGSLSARFILLGNVTNGVGVLNQNGGTVTANGNSGFDNLSVGNFFGGYGYYGANSGTLTVNGICIGGEANNGGGASFGSPGGNGIMEVNGGAVDASAGWIVLARQNSGVLAPSTGILNVYSGSLSYGGGGIVGPWDAGLSATINILGGSVTSSGQGVRLGNTGFLGTLNLDGGLLEATEITGYNGPTYAVVTAGLLNFNGGTLQAANSSADFLRVTRASVYSGGAVIDNNGNPIQINAPLVAPAGNGVNGYASFTAGAGYIAPPVVTITNGVGDTTGNGATAIAQIDPVAGTVTNIIITCPGVNYTATPIFQLSGGGATTQATVTGQAPTPNTSGGVTFIGSTITALSATNTYAGNTVVGSGTLELINPVVPSGSTLVVSNGATVQLDFTGTNTIAGLVLNGVSQPKGTYNSTTSPSFITGSGNLLVGVTTASNSTNITVSASGGNVNISWPADHLGWILQEQTNALNSASAWIDLAGTATVTSTNVPINPAQPRVFFRLRHP